MRGSDFLEPPRIFRGCKFRETATQSRVAGVAAANLVRHQKKGAVESSAPFPAVSERLALISGYWLALQDSLTMVSFRTIKWFFMVPFAAAAPLAPAEF